MDKQIRVSVRELVEYVLRSGDIDSNYISQSRMQDGIRIHQRIQKRRAKEAERGGYVYEKEFSLRHSFVIEGFTFSVDGRADGIIRRDGAVCVEEIKSTLADVSLFAKNTEHVHFAQAKCYAYMLCLSERLSEAAVMLTYCNTESGETREFREEYGFDELEGFFMPLCLSYFARAAKDYERKELRNAAVKLSGFPYSGYRKGQRELAVKVYRAIENSERLFAQAPTGTGKTISTLFPAVKSIGEGLCDKIFYLTAKTVTRQVAEEGVRAMRSAGHKLNSLTLTAKEKSCLNSEMVCSPDRCEYAKGHFDRVNDALEDILAGEDVITREEILLYAKKHCVCPHEFSLDVSLWVDVLICDYNHVFDPKARLKRFFGDIVTQRYVLLIDEAHNLVDRAREMFSCEVRRKPFVDMKKASKGIDNALNAISGKFGDWFQSFKDGQMEGREQYAAQEPPDELYDLYSEFLPIADRYLAAHSGMKDKLTDDLLPLYFAALDYKSFADAFDKRYVCYCQSSGIDLSVKLLCLDPSASLKEIHSKARASVFFSATLTPGSYFKRVFGADRDDDVFKLSSPFPRDNLCLAVNTSVSTKYRSRAASYAAIADNISAAISARRGNYLVFFSSYSYLSEVLSIVRERNLDADILVQTQNLSDSQKEDFLLNFKADPNRTLLAFTVLGGVFSEGIDLRGDRLIGVIVVGVGLPQVSAERNLIKEYWDNVFGDYEGYTYAYVYPGINKVLQAAGRLIRTETDRGIILLIDERYGGEDYQSLFPQEWHSAKYVQSAKEAHMTISDFWGVSE